MNSIIDNQREILLSVEGTNIWSGQQPQQYNSQAVAWGGLRCSYGHSYPMETDLIVLTATSSLLLENGINLLHGHMLLGSLCLCHSGSPTDIGPSCEQTIFTRLLSGMY